MMCPSSACARRVLSSDRASFIVASWRYLLEKQGATLSIFYLLLVLSCLFLSERMTRSFLMVCIMTWKRSALKMGFPVRGQKFSKAIIIKQSLWIILLPFQSCFGSESGIYDLPFAANTHCWALPWGPLVPTHHQVCQNAL